MLSKLRRKNSKPSETSESSDTITEVPEKVIYRFCYPRHYLYNIYREYLLKRVKKHGNQLQSNLQI